MVVFDIEDIKLKFMNSIRTYVYPQQTDYSNSISLQSTNGTLSQSLYLFSNSISGLGVYINSIVGNPDKATLTLYNGTNVVKSSTIPSTVGWNTISYSAMDLSSSRASSLVVTCGVNTINNYYIGCNTIPGSYFWGNNTINLAFTIGVKDFVYKVFPAEEITASRMPVISLDIIGRPKVDERYLSGDNVWMYVNVRAEIYSKYTYELDKLVTGADRGMVKNGRGFYGINSHVTPGNLSEITFIKSELYTRNITWQLRKMIARE